MATRNKQKATFWKNNFWCILISKLIWLCQNLQIALSIFFSFVLDYVKSKLFSSDKCICFSFNILSKIIKSKLKYVWYQLVTHFKSIFQFRLVKLIFFFFVLSKYLSKQKLVLCHAGFVEFLHQWKHFSLRTTAHFQSEKTTH